MWWLSRRGQNINRWQLWKSITLFIMLEPAARHSAPNQSWKRKIFVVLLSPFSLLALSNQVDITNCSHYRHCHDQLITSILITIGTRFAILSSHHHYQYYQRDKTNQVITCPPKLSVTISSGNFWRNSLEARPPGPSSSSSILRQATHFMNPLHFTLQITNLILRHW